MSLDGEDFFQKIMHKKYFLTKKNPYFVIVTSFLNYGKKVKKGMQNSKLIIRYMFVKGALFSIEGMRKGYLSIQF